MSRRAALAARFAGEPIVVVRSRRGELFALENRCAHRQVPLHVGVVTDCAIRCGYHGWEYDASGRCVSVPYLDACAMQPNNVRSYPTREAYGLVFVFPGDPARAASVAFPPSRRPQTPPTRRATSIVASIAITRSCTRTCST